MAWIAIPVLLASTLPSSHAEELEAHRHEPPAIATPPQSFGAPTRPRVNRVVYGYYPYWVSQLGRVRWDLLTHIAYFAVEIDPDGTASATHGWPNAAFVDTAHTHGVKVDITFTLFDGDGIATLTGSPANRARAIDTMITAMEAGAADGINVDFEGVESASRDGFTTFIRELRETLTARGHPGAGIGIAGPAVDYGRAFDFTALAELIDVYFIMGYGYHWGRSSRAGPVGQLRVTDAWRAHISISMERTFAHYTGLVGADRRAKIIHGVPYYGYDWPVDSESIHASTTGTGNSRTYAVARRAIAAGRTRRWDGDSENPWYAYYDTAGMPRQTWYDDEESLAAKYQLVLEQDLGGVGIWALGYDEDYPELWALIESYFTLEPEEYPLGTRQNPKLIAEFPFEEANDTRAAPSNYFNAYACAPATPEYGREQVYSFRLCGSGRFTASVTDGAGVDVDLQLLRAPDEAECIARHDAMISEHLMPGTYWLTADTYVSDHVAQPGEYQLTATLTLDDPNAECPPETPPKNTPPLAVEPAKDPPSEVASIDLDQPPPPPPDPPIVTGEVTPSPEACGCATTGGRETNATLLLVLLFLARSMIARCEHRCSSRSWPLRR